MEREQRIELWITDFAGRRLTVLATRANVFAVDHRIASIERMWHIRTNVLPLVPHALHVPLLADRSDLC